jgi:hypothetical protein
MRHNDETIWPLNYCPQEKEGNVVKCGILILISGKKIVEMKTYIGTNFIIRIKLESNTKSKVVPVHAMKAYKWSTVRNPRVLNLGATWG